MASSVQIENVSITEGDNGTKLLTFTVTRTGGTEAFNLNYGTANGTATAADFDYTARFGVLHFDVGANTRTIPVTIFGNTKLEPTETFAVNLVSATNGVTISDGQGIGTILTDDNTLVPHDFNGDLKSDILFQHTSGAITTWEMDGTAVIGGGLLYQVDASWKAIGTGDFNGDSKSDILWQHTSGAITTWEMDGTTAIGGGLLYEVDSSWEAIGTGDFNGDSKSDILFQHTSGPITTWEMNGTAVTGGGLLYQVDASWHIV